MAKTKNKNKIKKINNDFSGLGFIKWIPFILFVNVMPFIVKMHMTKIHGPFEDWMPPETEYMDVFGYYKMIILYTCATLAVLWLFVEYMNTNYNKVNYPEGTTIKNFFKTSPENRVAKIFYKKDIIVFLIIGLMILSSLFSQYKPVTFFGYRERFLGLFSWLSFFIMFFYIRQIIKDKKDLHFAVGSLMVTGLFLGIIGVMQSMGHDPFRMDFFKSMIATKEIVQNNMLDSIQFTFSPTRVYMTLYNPNNVGVVVAGLAPVGIYGAIYGKNKIYKLIGGVSAVLLLISLWRSESRAGIVAIGLSAVITMIMFCFSKLKFGKKFSKIVVLILMLCIFFSGVFLLNKVISKIIISDQQNLFYKYVSDIDIKKNICEVVYENKKIIISYDINNIGELCNISDYEGNEIQFKSQEDGYYTIFDDLPEKFKIRYGSLMDDIYLELKMPYVGTLYLMMTEKGFYFINSFGNVISNEHVPSIGFRNHQKIASGRGYIWSRSIPILEKRVILGVGSECYPYIFPQNDFIGKALYMYNPYIIVDKPHNQYLGWWIEFGFVAFIFILAWLVQVIMKNKQNLLVVSLLGVLLGFLFYDLSIYTGWIFMSLLAMIDSSVTFDDAELLKK